MNAFLTPSPENDRQRAADAGEPIRSEPLSRSARLLAAAYLAAALLYLGWRPFTFNGDALLFSSVVYAAELFGFGLTLLHLFMTGRLTFREPPPAMAGLAVDVFVPTINEPAELVRRTLLAAVRMDYPHQTWLLDDGNRPEMRALADELGCRYLARSENTDAKAGNLNNALRHARGEFVAFFDADHAPRRDFLTRTLGYFRDADTAFVQTPQDFFNLDSYEHRQADKGRRVWMEQSFFWRIIQRGKDFWNAAFFCGSCAVMRRSALDGIGGVAIGSVTEDLLTSLRLHKKGWRSVYHAESLAFGVAPAGAAQYLKQRLRWAQGAMQVWRSEGVLFARGLTGPQRLCYLATVCAYLDGWQKLVFYLAPVFVLLTGIMPLTELDAGFFVRFVPYYLLTFLVFEEMGRGYGRALLIEQYNMARFAAFLMASFGYFRKKVRFAVTDKALGADKRSLLPLAPQLAVFGLNFLAVPAALAIHARVPVLPDAALAANIVWALVNSGLAAILLRFHRGRSRFQRREYRFPVPLPARLTTAGEPAAFGTIDDISGEGFSFYGRVGDVLRPGGALRVDIFMPTTVLAVEATVRSLRHGGTEDARYVKAVGCSFSWRDRDEQDQLTVFLYGSDAQWKINRFDERAPTPLQRLLRWLSGRPPEKPAAVPRWAPAIVRTADAPVMAIISIGAAERHLIALRPVPAGVPLALSAYTRRGVTRLGSVAELRETIATPTQPMHHYVLRGNIRNATRDQ